MSGVVQWVRASRGPSLPDHGSSIVASGPCSAQNPTNIVPWRSEVPQAVLRRKMWP